MTDNVPPYNRKLVPRAKEMRNNSTPAEIELWKQLRRRQLLGYKFRRQQTIDNYIVDFYSRELNLVIEIDGSSHDDKEDYDKERQAALEGHNLHFLRFSNEEVLSNIETITQKIENWIIKHR